ARSSQTTNTSGDSSSGWGPASPEVGNSSEAYLVCQSAASRFAISESAGLHRVGLSVPSRIAWAASSEPLATSLTLTDGLSRSNQPTASSSHSFFSVEYSSVISTDGPATGWVLAGSV